MSLFYLPYVVLKLTHTLYSRQKEMPHSNTPFYKLHVETELCAYPTAKRQERANMVQMLNPTQNRVSTLSVSY